MIPIFGSGQIGLTQLVHYKECNYRNPTTSTICSDTAGYLIKTAMPMLDEQSAEEMKENRVSPCPSNSYRDCVLSAKPALGSRNERKAKRILKGKRMYSAAEAVCNGPHRPAWPHRIRLCDSSCRTATKWCKGPELIQSLPIPLQRCPGKYYHSTRTLSPKISARQLGRRLNGSNSACNRTFYLCTFAAGILKRPSGINAREEKLGNK